VSSKPTFWMSDTARNEVSILGLVASDAAYKQSGFAAGAVLQSVPDNEGGEDYPFPATLLSSMGEQGIDPLSRLFYQLTTSPGKDAAPIRTVEFQNWHFNNLVEDPSSGLAFVIYERTYDTGNALRKEYLVAFRGTDGRNGRDWYANIQLGKDQWRDAVGLLFGPSGLISRLTSPDGSIPRIHFTGQSLGGALAQYAAYEYVRQRETDGQPLFDEGFSGQRSDLVTLTTFNAFAAGLGLSQLYSLETGGSENFNPKRLSGVSTAHYSIENDVVHNLGGLFDADGILKTGFLNGVDGDVNNLYHFADWRHWNTPLGSPPGSPGEQRTDPQGYLDLVEGHRIETGFYQGLDRYNATFTSAIHGGDPTGLIKLDSLQAVGEIFARFLGGDRSSEFASWARITAGVAMGSLFASVGDVARLLKLVGNSLYKSDDVNGFTRAVIASNIGSHFSAVSLKLLAKPAIAVAGASSLVAAIADLFGKGADRSAATELINRNISSDQQFQEIDATPVNDEDASSAADSARHFSLLLDYLQPEILKGTVLEDDVATWNAISDDPIQFTTALYGGEDGYRDALVLLTNEAKTEIFASDNTRTLDFATDLALFGASEAKRVARDIDIRASLDEDIGDYILDLTAAVANLSPELLTSLHQQTDLVLAPVSSSRDYRQLVDLLLDDLEDFRTSALFGLSAASAPELDATLKEARASLVSAAQTPVIARFAAKPANPFDDASFDPDSVPAATGELEDGGAGTYVVFLPYEANQGGQQVRLELPGVPSDKVTVLSEGAPVPLVEGAFVLTIAEGRRQAAFTLEAASDLGASGSLLISATLIGTDNVATHGTQLEANIALKHEDQTFENAFDVASAVDFRSADRISGYFDDAGGQNDPTAIRTQLVGSGYGDLVLGDHASELIVVGAGNDFVIEGRGSGGGTYTAADAIEVGDGNDIVTGHLGSRIAAGDGDDFVNPNDLFRLGAARLDSGQGSLPEFPGAIYADLAQFLRIRPSGDGPIFNSLVGGLDFTYTRDFGDNNLGNPITGTSAKLGVVSVGSSTEIQRTAAGGAAFQFTTFNRIANINYIGADAPLTYGVAFETTGDLHNTQEVQIDGGGGNDLLYGAAGEDFIQGGSGDDRIAGFLGDDTLEGEDGNDQVVAGAGDDYVDGGTGDDRLWGEGENDGLWGGAGNDIIFGDANTTPIASQGGDYLDGGAGDDQLFGNGGNDELFGGDGVDLVDGGTGNDYLDGERGNDTLFAGSGDDELYGGEDNDVLTAGDGSDYLDGQSGVDQLDGGAGSDTLYGGDGTDTLVGGLDDDLLDGEAGTDLLAGGSGNDTLYGGDGSDKLEGGEGNDILNGGAGDNVLLGGAGDDTYTLALGDGSSVIDDQSGANRILYGDGIFADDIVAAYTDPAFGSQDLVLTYGGGASSRTSIKGGGAAIGSLEFADGTTLSLAQLLATNLAPGFVKPSNILIGTAGNDTLRDITGRDVVVYALEGNDVVETGGGSDVLHGGPGSDNLLGGRGDDVYQFSRGDGEDRITDSDNSAGNSDRIVYATDVLPSQIQVSRSGDDLVLTLAASADRITVSSYFQNDGTTPNSIEAIEFLSDGTVWNLDTVKQKALTGTTSNDLLTGYATADVMRGLAGNDVLMGRGGDDILDGGGGLDTLLGGLGNDTYVFARGAGTARIDEEHLSIAGSGYDAVQVSADIAPWEVHLRRVTSQNLELRLADGSVLVVDRQFNPDGSLAEPIEQIRFAYDGTIWDLAMMQQIIRTATPRDDVLWGTTGDDVFQGLGGNDVFWGEQGNDTYYFDRGDGNDNIFEQGSPSQLQLNRLIFGQGIAPTDVTPWRSDSVGGFSHLTLVLDNGSSDSVRIDNYFGIRMPEIRFADGTVWTEETIAAFLPLLGTEGSDVMMGYLAADVVFLGGGHDRISTRTGADVVYGGDGNDIVSSLDGNDRFYGEAGNDSLTVLAAFGLPGTNLLDGGPGNDLLRAAEGDDTLIGGTGDDSLDGGGGVDFLSGGSGNDTYFFGEGYGFDTLEDFDVTAGNFDRIIVQGPNPAEVVGVHTATHRILVLNERDQLSIRWDPAASEIEEVRFSNGTVWNAATLLEKTATEVITNRAPVVVDAIPSQTGYEDAAFAFVVPGNSFSDPDVGDTLVYAATSLSGGPLPDWLSFDDMAVAFAGTPAQADVGSVGIRVTAMDAEGLSAQSSFMLVIAPTNDAPVLSSSVADQTVAEDAPFSLAIPADAFSDEDPGETLLYSAARVDGSALPAWLWFNASDRTFSGTPGNADVGTMAVRISATDSAGATASDFFAVHVLNVNDVPIVAQEIADQAVDAESLFTLTVATTTFQDVDAGDSLALAAAGFGGTALPAWLAFDPASATFSGAPSSSDVGIYGVVVRATDTSGESAISEFTLAVRALAGSSISGRAGDDVIIGGIGGETLSGGKGDDALFGDVGDDVLRGGTGSDVLQGGSGADVLHGGTSGNVLDGGSGDDVIFDGAGDSFISGGAGDDSIRTGTGHDVIAFDRGDGWDTVYGGGDGGNTLSLGGGIRYADLFFSKSGDDLLMHTGEQEGMLFKDWYAGNQSVLNLQLMLDATQDFDSTSSDGLYNQRVQTFNFLGLVGAFDQTRAASPGVTSWDVTNALLQWHLRGSDDAALGGDLAYWYGSRRGLAGFSLQAAQEAIGMPGFGSDAHSLRPFSGLQEGLVKLS
jgi:Ca2+-binding RTX toxin-like protein